MAEPISIGGQTFIKTGDGWIDKKSKIPADKGLIKLLNSLETDGPSPKLRVRIDKSREPVNFAGTKYVYDLNQKGWIDQKTKVKVHDKLQNILNGVSKPMAAPSTLGIVGQVGVSKIKEKAPITGAGAIPISQKQINTPIVTMIEKLSSIDGYLKQKLNNQKKIAKGQLQATREAAIESKPDATSMVQVEKEESGGKSNVGAIALGTGLAVLFASQFEPVKDAFKSIADGVKGVYNFVTDFARIMANGLGALLGGDAAPSNSEPATTTPVTRPSPTSDTPVSVPIPSMPNEVEVPSTPNEASQATESATTTSGSAPTPSSSSGSSSGSRALAGAATGAMLGAVAGPVGMAAGAAIGGAVGYFSGRSSSIPTPSDATPESANTGGGERLKDYVGELFVLGGGRTGNARNLENLDPEFEQQVIGALKDYRETGARPPVLTSGFRYPGDQEAISGYMKAGAGKSRHERGLALDFNSADVNRMSTLGILRDHGLHQRYGARDPVHIEQIGPGGEGTSYQGGEDGGNLINRVTGSVADLAVGTMKAIGNIMSAGLGPQESRNLRDSLNQNPEAASQAITRAAVDRTVAIANERSASQEPITVPPPMNINNNPESAAVQNIPTGGDRAGIDNYLVRFGFPKINYKQRAAA